MTQGVSSDIHYCANSRPLYEITDITKQVEWPDGSKHTVRRLRFVYKPEKECDLEDLSFTQKWPRVPQYGDLMGWVECRNNLGANAGSIYYVPYIGEDAVISGKRQVLHECTDVIMYGNTHVFGDVRIHGWNVSIHGNALIGGNIDINASAEIFGNAKLLSRDNSLITVGAAVTVFENATVFARDNVAVTLGDHCRIYGNASISASKGNKAGDEGCLYVAQYSRLLGNASLCGRASKFSGTAVTGTF